MLPSGSQSFEMGGDCSCFQASLSECGGCGAFEQCFSCGSSCRYTGPQCAGDLATIFYQAFLPVVLTGFLGIPVLAYALRAWVRVRVRVS
jgi:hypothetical protein